MLKIQKGMTNQEVAAVMKITVATVKSHYTQVIKLLRSQMDKIVMILLATKDFI